MESLLKDCGFCSIERKEFMLSDNKAIKYYCCKKSYGECKWICNNCNEIFARYIIIDITEKKTSEICNQYIFNSEEAFKRFQSENISRIFFYESEFVRYNIYLIFICDRPNIDKYLMFSNNLDYARKLFLTKMDFCRYFSVFSNTFKSDKESTLSRSEEVINDLKQQMMHKGTSYLLTIQDTPKQDKAFIFYSYILSDFDTFDDFYKKAYGFSHETTKKQTNKSKNIKHSNNDSNYISEIILNRYRTNNYDTNTRVGFGLCNLLYGENSAGKTSILDAIEMGCTGTTKGENEKDELVTIIWNDGNKMSSNMTINQRQSYKDRWYPNDIGDINSIFRQINYFNIDATFDFALKPNSFELSELFCDSELFNIKDRLVENEQAFRFLSNLFNEKTNNIYFKNNIVNRTLRVVLNYLPILTERKNNSVNTLKYYIKRQPKELKRLSEDNRNALKRINDLILQQINSNMELINDVFSRLFSYNYMVKNQNGNYVIYDMKTENEFTVEEMSTAQRVCLALSLIFSKFLISKSAPRFILLDESVANLDSVHLLNLLDFLRDATLNGIQIFFTTANYDVYKIAKSKFSFLGEDFYSYKLSKSEEGKAIIKRELISGV